MDGTDGRAPHALPETENLYWYMLAAAEQKPDAVAVHEIGPDGNLSTISYRQLQQRVHDFAAGLEQLGLDVGDRVVLESEVSAHVIALLLACSWLGLAFIPVTPETPAKRLEAIIERSGAALHLQYEAGRRDGIPEGVGTGRFGRNGLLVERRPAPRTRYRTKVVPTDTAYIVFTSGTTGRPKGVVMNHRAVTSFCRGALQAGVVRPTDRVAITAPFQFDFALAGIGMTLGRGATVVPVPPDRLGWPGRFTGFLRDTQVSQVQGVPSIWRTILRDEPERLGDLGQLRDIVFAGEEFPLHELRQVRQLLPRVRLLNGYGATESIACAVAEVPDRIPDDLDRLPIGFAIPGAEMVLVDAAGRPIAEPAVVGEIYLHSDSLFTGYWDDPEATGAALVPDPLSPSSGRLVFRSGDLAYRGQHGELYFCGRADSLVKVRGNRVELGEVESRLMAYPGVAAAVALLAPRSDGEKVLSAFVIYRPDSPATDTTGLRAFCAEALPAYMTPGEIHVLDEFPLTGNGKIDRAALATQAHG
jgi:amino acid adenylation domain-containing protein